jgi:hypothetical protein
MRRPTHLARQPRVVDETGWTIRRGVPPLHECLGHEHDGLARDVVFPQELSEDPLRVALGVGIGGVERLRGRFSGYSRYLDQREGDWARGQEKTK